MDFQEITLIGNVGNVQKARQTPNGKKVMNATLAVNDPKSETPTWYKLVGWEKVADLIEKYVFKGDKLFITGRPSVEVWKDTDGDPYAQMVVTINQIRFLSPKGE